MANNTAKTKSPVTIITKLLTEVWSIKNNNKDKLKGASESTIIHPNGASSSSLSVLFLINFNFGTKAWMIP